MAAEAENEQEKSRKLRYFQCDDGVWVINARLPAEEGALVVVAIEAVARAAQEAPREQLQGERDHGSEKNSARRFPRKSVKLQVSSVLWNTPGQTL